MRQPSGRAWVPPALVLLGMLTAGAVPAARAQDPLFRELRRMLPWDTDIGWDGAVYGTVAVGDVDGDGDLDALLAGRPILLYRNDGLGRFLDGSADLPIVGGTAALGDLDGDGDLDVLAVSRSGPGITGETRLLLNDGQGVFVDASAQVPDGSGGDLALGDVDGDGDLDALVSSRLFLNDGAGVLAQGMHPPPWTGFDFDLALGDLDGDHDLDVVAGISFGPSAGQLSLALNDGTGVFTDASSGLPGITAGYGFDLELGDVDEDGDLDVFVTRGVYNGSNQLFLNDGAAHFADASTHLPAGNYWIYDLAIGDVDGDGDLDALGAGSNQLLLNDGDGLFSPDTLELSQGLAHTVGLGDWDGDGDLDALMGALTAQPMLALNTGRGHFEDVTAQLPGLRGAAIAISVGDVDGDGDLDVVLGEPQVCGEFGCSEVPDRLYLNRGNGTFSDASGLLPIPSGNRAVGSDPYAAAIVHALVDLDGDQDLDALGTVLFFNDGAGSFSDATASLPGAFATFRDLAVADVDADGDPDVALAEHQQRNSLLLNGGLGDFVDASTNLPPFAVVTNAVVFGDIDGDADLDLIFGNWSVEHLHLNDGTGRFVDASGNLPPDPDWTNAVALADVDGDGDLDAYLANGLGSSDPQDHLYLNDGAGLFLDATRNLPPDTSQSRAVALADVDDDGDIDAYVSNVSTQGDRLLLNDGSGTFREPAGSLPEGLVWSSAVALEDLDGDGDVDAFLGVPKTTDWLTGFSWGGEDRILFNLARQLAWRSTPRVGKPLPLDLHGPPGQAFLLFASTGTATIPLPFGTFRLDPLRTVSLGTGVLDPQGAAAVTFAVPADPALVGLSLYWQALQAPPRALTNLEVTTLADL